ncbi:MAG: amidohydrolase family protein [Parvularculaceae bacterium]|nr:amidohydrolase family protein [Parvularculaceae bacterium]
MKTLAALLAAGSSLFSLAFAEGLAEPPASAKTWSILSAGGQHGEERVWTDKDGVRRARMKIVLRGLTYDVDHATTIGADGRVASMEIRGVTPSGDATESFRIENNVARWKTPADAGEAPWRDNLVYIPFGGPADVNAMLLGALLKDADGRLEALPGGEVRVSDLTTLTVTAKGKKKTLTAKAVEGVSFDPLVVWTDDKGALFATVGWLSWLPKGWEGVRQQLIDAETEALAARAPALVARIAKKPESAVLFRNVTLFDGAAFKKKMSVLVEGDRITAVGKGKKVKAPAGASVIDGAEKTLVPGLWDMHYHSGGDGSGVLALSQGVVNVRDIGNEKATLLARKKRIDEGQLLGPTIFPILGMDGDGPLSAQGFVRIKSIEEGKKELGIGKDEGHLGVKLYGTINPEWVAPLAEEAHRLGMSVQGHIPAGMRPSAAVAAGYDGINHINFVVMDAMPDEVVETSNGLNRFFGPGKHAQHIDLNAEPMKGFIETLAAKQIVIDPTLTVYEQSFVPAQGEVAAAALPFVGVVPPQVERGFKSGGLVAPEGFDATREDMRASFLKLVETVRVMHEKGVPIVAGTDGYPSDLIRELELYVIAGMTNAEALATATSVAANVIGAGGNTGSIAVGQEADLLLVKGDVSKSIAALRQVDLVMQNGRMMEGAALREAAGYSGLPK